MFEISQDYLVVIKTKSGATVTVGRNHADEKTGQLCISTDGKAVDLTRMEISDLISGLQQVQLGLA